VIVKPQGTCNGKTSTGEGPRAFTIKDKRTGKSYAQRRHSAMDLRIRRRRLRSDDLRSRFLQYRELPQRDLPTSTARRQSLSTAATPIEQLAEHLVP